MSLEWASGSAVEIAFLPSRILIQYQPALDPVGRHWDAAVQRVAKVYPQLDEDVWDMIEEPVLVLDEDSEDETQWFLMEFPPDLRLVGRLRTLTLEEQAEAYLADGDPEEWKALSGRLLGGPTE